MTSLFEVWRPIRTFGVARIDRGEDYEKRRGISIKQAEKYLRANIG